ncbi:hypothetical protein [Lactiplantibacillus mudanjiangensis]|uniref:Uncharacterized protein n=1 Tax=Lactiplantibacillus mudanjiangensis TaxID=1296538 RepID=A0A660E440_9LACO|nr:hypothetical protein [Lactiplantibacillus mudanjiangensis]VDG20113.1 hypothetical protein [Lactobacillus paracollinoides] [Lactiplantibacillus mudanjiangensis]VDG23810.1 hypothetical protein [Lactobacillus paracollinoides] [Lactiplantibacillus mudanjiangensis]VDG30370.1 hypothetical protein [Lactobacillus paracollinoides] [Lactiplantibacillus mudanjiangensis]VDG33508.1 hypothetical protein [Lactobacillus paracollinoides] [Lactiplantibacillus mudanjiangensis]
MTKLRHLLLVIAMMTGLTFGGLTLLSDAQQTNTVAAATTKSAKTLFKANVAKNAVMSKSVFKMQGRVKWQKKVYTYYSPNGSGMYGMGRFTSDGTYTLNGYDKDGYLILANNKKFGTKIKTPLGMGKVHDRGTYGNHYDIVVQ